MHKDFETIEHTADIKVRVYGETLSQFYRNALIAMFQVIKPHISGCTEINNRIVCPELPIKHEFNIRSIDKESVLVDFLSEALCLSDIHNEAYLDATITNATDTTVQGTLHGIKIKGFEGVEIKAVTYHQLTVRQVNNMWQADIVFDI